MTRPPAGNTLVEVLVALVLLAVGGALAMPLLSRAGREMEGAELGLRAALLLSEMSVGREPGPERRAAAGGRFVLWSTGDTWLVRFDPGATVSIEDVPSVPGSAGYFEERTWSLRGAP